MDDALFSIDARPDAAVQRQVQRGDAKEAARRQRKRELRAREHKLARSVFADEGSEEEADDDDDAAAAPAADADEDEFGGEDGEGDDDGDDDGDGDGDGDRATCMIVRWLMTRRLGRLRAEATAWGMGV